MHGRSNAATGARLTGYACDEPAAGAATVGVPFCNGSIAVQIQSGCCSISRPKRIEYSAFDVDSR
jgi:hypothetical protein